MNKADKKIDKTNDQQIIEQLRAENELKTKWLSLIAHDFKGLFSSISFLLDAFDNKSISQEMFMSMLPEIRQITDKNIKTLENTFAWVNSQTDGCKLQLEEVTIHELFSTIKEDLDSEVKLKNITLNFSGDENASLCTDKFLLAFILKQAIENAIKYSHKNEEVAFVVNKTKDGLSIEIRDFGLGMNEAVLNSMYTLNESPYKGSMGEKGAGLSLVIVKEFVEKLNGKIHISSIKEEGTTIKLFFSETDGIPKE